MAAITEQIDFNGKWDGEAILVVTFATISLYNAFELLLIVFTTFKEWRSLYFISLLVASIGVIPYCIGFIVEYFGLLVFWAAMIFSSIGWVMMVTGQAFVLYSRLGLILQNEKILKAVKWMIIVDAIVFHITTTVVQYGKAYGGEQNNFQRALFYMEKIQMTGFCIQEFIISGLYLWKSVQLLRIVSKEHTRRVMWELFIINIVIILMDIALLGLEYSGLRTQERSFKSFCYSVKLKLEFAILGKLVDLVHSSNRTVSYALEEVPSFVDTSRSLSNPQYPLSPSRTRRDSDLPEWIAKLEKTHVQHIENARPAAIPESKLS